MITGHELHIQAKAAFEKETGIVYGYLAGFESGVKELTTEGLAQIQVFK